MNHQELLSLASELAIEPEDLDDLVHDLVQEDGLDELNAIEDANEQDDHITAGEQIAAGINNSGLEEQLTFLFGNLGGHETALRLKRIAANKERNK